METVIKPSSDLVERDISRLQERRETIFRNLEALRQALETLLGKSPDFSEDIEPFLNIPDDGKGKALEMAFGIWLSKQTATFNVLPAKAREALGYVPAEVEAVVSAWQSYADTSSQEPARYWSAAKQSFKLLGVTEAEKGKIVERSTLRALSPEHAEMLDLVKKHAQLFSFLNKHYHGPYTAGYLEKNMPWWRTVLKPLKGPVDHMGGGAVFEYEPNWSMFTAQGEPFDAFDEY